jgi:hypothetical protein
VTLALIAAGMVAFNGWLAVKAIAYARETARLRAGMTTVERQRADLALANDKNHLRVMLELIRRQAQGDKELHLSIAVDSDVMHLEREGNHLREMRVEVGPERWVGHAPDTVKMTAPRGARTVERLLDEKGAWEVPRWVYEDRKLPVPDIRTIPGALGPAAVVLSGGIVLYSLPTVGPLADSTYLLPGSVRVSASDLRAIVPDLRPGISVYFY